MRLYIDIPDEKVQKVQDALCSANGLPSTPQNAKRVVAQFIQRTVQARQKINLMAQQRIDLDNIPLDDMSDIT